jgi:hypothetical protein
VPAVHALGRAVAPRSAVVDVILWLGQVGPSTPPRLVLVLLAGVLIVAHLRLRDRHPRAAVLLIDAAGVAMLLIGLSLISFDGPVLDNGPAGWEAVLLVAGCGLAAFAAVERRADPALLGAAVLGAFVLVAGGGSVLWWPILLLVLGGTVVAAGLRPARPLPPEPGDPEPDTPSAIHSPPR